jgi:membrane protein YdbS with pleckstrin-like domain
MKCPVCDTQAAAGAAFCQHCGAKLPRFDAGSPTRSPADTQPPTAAEAAPGMTPTARRRGAADVPEETLWEGSYSPKAMLGSLVGCAAASVLLIGCGIAVQQSAVWMALGAVIVLLWLAVALRLAERRLGVHYKLTNQMFYHQRGVLTRVTSRVEAIDIDDVTYEQGLLERMVNVGRIKITSSDRTDPELWVVGVEDVQDVAQKIDKARRAERMRRGMSVEQV